MLLSSGIVVVLLVIILLLVFLLSKVIEWMGDASSAPTSNGNHSRLNMCNRGYIHYL